MFAQMVLMVSLLIAFPIWDVILTRRLRAAAQAGDIAARMRGHIETIVPLSTVAPVAVALAGMRAVMTIRTPLGWVLATAAMGAVS